MITKLLCTVSEGLRPSEALAKFSDYSQRTHFLRVERDFLIDENGKHFLTVGVVRKDARTGAVLVELPHEAETGANRLWVAQDQLAERVEAFA